MTATLREWKPQLSQSVASSSNFFSFGAKHDFSLSINTIDTATNGEVL